MAKRKLKKAVSSTPTTKQEVLDMLNQAQMAFDVAADDYIAAVDSGEGVADAARALTIATNNWHTAQTETLLYVIQNP